jgi:hypothetical protein
MMEQINESTDELVIERVRARERKRMAILHVVLCREVETVLFDASMLMLFLLLLLVSLYNYVLADAECGIF